MILAQSPAQTLMLMLLGMLCWGLWASTFKLTLKWRFELFYFDVSIGLSIAAVVYALTVGSLGFDGFSFEDDLLHAGKRQWLMAFGAGAAFNFGNMIMMAAISVAGLSVAVPIGLGVALMIGVGLQLILRSTGSPMLFFAGSACLVVAVAMMAVAYSFHVSARLEQLIKEGKVKTTGSGPGRGMIVSTNAPSATKGLLLASIAGAVMWIMFPLVNKARAGDNGMGPYSMMALFAMGVFASTWVLNLFFLNLPVEGEPLELTAYFRGRLKSHLAGLGAGIVLGTGILAYFVAQAGPPETQMSPLASYTIQQGAVLVAAIAGIFGWKDYRDAEPRSRAIVWAFLFLFAAGLAALGTAATMARPA
jgi:glucose uptake protein